ncbi:MAG: amidohydrolase family protein [Betaproteobacteria bacterium]|jgi:predicted TIM-barrel fold metal-dependent hydrolase|nr:amidohydrolase family protein [Rhodocyclaceae bacterium]MCA3135670.1 amidohydrolase family protein [Rhodocyclaceae bacterium]MCA3141275.1 amidohydrolase family protein [Rhodocyclaceae bacterium]MCA3145176.1 amidohydrolase family protein [Rhodocyclaceae bacterium]MCE2897315.1 amidohydrolase family protein [Betaproteobacteria bacterium]
MSEKPTGWLSDEEVARVAPAERAAFDAPVPTQIVSNGEFNPMPQTTEQRRVEALVKSLGSRLARRQGLSRRDFLRTASGMATAFLAMNEVFGPVWDVSEAEAADRQMADARAKALAGQFIFDVQTHFVRDDYTRERLLNLGRYAAQHWNPDMSSTPMTLARYKFQNYLREIFMDSDTKLALLSSATYDNPDFYFLFNDQMRDARALVNAVAGSKRLFAHSVVNPGKPGWLDEVDKAIEEYRPDSWKGYTTGDPSSPTKNGSAWRLDDEKLVYPFYEKAVKAGITTICVHKGLLPRDYEQSWKGIWEYATVADLPKAAKDWPQLNFVIYHSALRPLLEQPELELAEFESTGWIRWSTDLARIPAEHGVNNVFAEIGSSFANSAVANPRFCAAFLGQLVNEMGVDRVLWGTDSVWYGSPQWQIEALRRLEIPEDMARRHGWKTRLGGADSDVKRRIFGLNAARLYGIQPEAAYARVSEDHLTEMKARWHAAGEQRSNRAYGFVAA